MKKTKVPYREKFQKGSNVRIASKSDLEKFQENWRWHNKLEPSQLDYADKHAEVEAVFFYHGGDVLYKLKKISGVWHEQCLHPTEKGKKGSVLSIDNDNTEK